MFVVDFGAFIFRLLDLLREAFHLYVKRLGKFLALLGLVFKHQLMGEVQIGNLLHVRVAELRGKVLLLQVLVDLLQSSLNLSQDLVILGPDSRHLMSRLSNVIQSLVGSVDDGLYVSLPRARDVLEGVLLLLQVLLKGLVVMRLFGEDVLPHLLE